MVLLTIIARMGDGLPLCEGLDVSQGAEVDRYKEQAKVSSAHRGSRTREGQGSGRAGAGSGAGAGRGERDGGRGTGEVGGSWAAPSRSSRGAQWVRGS